MALLTGPKLANMANYLSLQTAVKLPTRQGKNQGRWSSLWKVVIGLIKQAILVTY